MPHSATDPIAIEGANDVCRPRHCRSPALPCSISRACAPARPRCASSPTGARGSSRSSCRRSRGEEDSFIGDRHVVRFPEPAPQQGEHHAQPEGAGGARDHPPAGAEGRRGGGELPARREEAARLDYETLAAINPRIVYGSISGFGQDGPYAKRPGVDQIAQGMSGIMSVTGQPGRGADARRHGDRRCDRRASICRSAFSPRCSSARPPARASGSTPRCSKALIALMDFQSATWLMEKHVPQQQGNDHPKSMPTSAFKTTRRLHQHRLAATRPAGSGWRARWASPS